MNSVIENLNGWGENYLRFAGPMLWQSSLLIAFVFGLDFLLARKIRAAVRYALWLAVLVKLLLPPALALPTGVAWWLFPAKPAMKAPAIKSYVVTYDHALPPVDLSAQTFVMPAPPAPKLNGAGWTVLVSAAVSAGLFLWLALRWWQVSQTIRRACVSENILKSADEARRFAGLHSSARVKITDDRMSPAVCGLFRPVILLPRALAERLSPAQLRAVLLHELFHLRRRDVWVNCAQALLQIFYWWHPLLWVANGRIRRLREEAVDDAVMLALRDEADSYAPTLLEVAKLAFRRPLMSLGLVGIMESRSALRQRIERLVDFHAPRRAGLTFASLCGIFVFSAVALPMGEGPAPAEKQTAPADGAVAEPTTLTLKVDPKIFIRNVKAQAAKTLLPQTNDYTEILLDLLRSEGVDSNPPHGLAFNNATGEITTQNTPDKLEIFRQVIEQLSRADGICELPLHNPPLQRKQVLIEAHVYPASASQFEKITAGLRRYPGGAGGDPWWSVPPGRVQQLIGDIEAAGLQAITRPRVLTSSGLPAIFYVGDGTNGTELACKPFAEDGFIDLTLHGTIVSGAPANGATNQVFSEASAENHGGIVLRMENSGGQNENSFVTVISMEIVTNGPARFQQRLTPLTKPASAATANSAPELVGDGKLFFEMGKWDEAEMKFQAALAVDAENASAKYYLSLIHTNRTNPKFVYTGPGRQEILRKLKTIRLENFSTGDRGLPLNEVLRHLAGQSKLFDPENKGINFLINNNSDRSGQPAAESAAETASTTNKPVDVGSCLIKIPSLTNVCYADLLDAVVLVADHPLKYSIQDFAVVFSAKVAEPALLFFRTFKLDTNVIYRAVQAMGTPPASSASEVMRSFLKNLGVNMESPKGKTVFYNATRGVFSVKATEEDLDLIEKALRLVDQTSTGVQSQRTLPKNSTNGTGILSGTNFQAALRALEQRDGIDSLGEPEVTTSSGRGINRITTTNISVPISNMVAECSQATMTFKIVRPIRSEELKAKLLEAGVKMPPTVYFYTDAGILLVRGAQEQLAQVHRLVLKLNGYSTNEIEAVSKDFSTTQAVPPKADATATNLFTRTFRVDPHTFYRSLEDALTQSFGSLPKRGSNVGIGDSPDLSPSTSVYASPEPTASNPSALAREFFSDLGVNLQNPSGKSVFFNDRLGMLFVKATAADLDTIERAIQALNQVVPQIHIKARFYEVPKGFMKPNGNLRFFQTFTGAFNSAARITGILSATNARAAMRSLQARSDIEVLAEPEVTTISGRQTQMRATQIVTVVTNMVYQETFTNQDGTLGTNAIVPQTSKVETGPVLDVVPYVLADGYTINLALIPSLTEFLGYDKSTNSTAAYDRAGEKIDVPEILPRLSVQQAVATVNLWDDQTAVLAGLPEATYVNGKAIMEKPKNSDKELLIFVTATIVDPAGNRVHADSDLPFAQTGVPPQPAPGK